MELDSIFDMPHISNFRNSLTFYDSSHKGAESEEESESTVL